MKELTPSPTGEYLILFMIDDIIIHILHVPLHCILYVYVYALTRTISHYAELSENKLENLI